MTEPKPMLTATPLAAGNDAYVEAMYERYLAEPESVDAQLARLFCKPRAARPATSPHGPLDRGTGAPREGAASSVGRTATAAAGRFGTPRPATRRRPSRVPSSRLIQMYANRGHLIADIDPLGLMVRPVPKVLGLDYLGLTEADLDTEFLTGSRNEAIKPRLKLRDIIAQLQAHLLRHDRRRVRARVR